MKVAIHKDYYKINQFNDKYLQILEYNGIDYQVVDINEDDFWRKIEGADLFIYRWFHFDNDRMLSRAVMPVIENTLGIKTFPDMNTSWHFDDKIKQYYLLKQNGFPYTDSWIFWQKEPALNWLKTTEFPVIFKLKGGAGSSNVIKVDNKKTAEKLIGIMFGKGVISGRIPISNSIYKSDIKTNLKYSLRSLLKKIIRIIEGADTTPMWRKHKNYVMFQKYLPKNDFDTRITVIGNRAFGFRRINRTNDFRASGSGKLDHDRTKIDLKFVELAFEISKKLKFQSMAYDFLYNEQGGIEICEISYSFQDKAVYNCPGYWDEQLSWHEGHYLPQYCQLCDLLDQPDLKQPEIIDFSF